MNILITTTVGYGASWLGWITQPFPDTEKFTKEEFIRNVLSCQRHNISSKFAAGCYAASDLCCLKFMKDYVLRLDRIFNAAKDNVCTNESIVKIMTKIKCDLLDYFCKKDLSDIIIDLKNWFQKNWSVDASILKCDIIVRLSNWIWDLRNGIVKFLQDRLRTFVNQLVLLMSLLLDTLSMLSTDIYNNFINSLRAGHNE